MRPRDRARGLEIERTLDRFHSTTRQLPGVQAVDNKLAFVEQLIESLRRIRYVHTIRGKNLDPGRKDPASTIFDPIMAAALHARTGDIDEACWLVFLATHFGKNVRTGWRLTQDIYGALGSANIWNWNRTSSDPQGFSQWLADNYVTLTSDGVLRRFGNHRKYETLNPRAHRSTGSVVESYVAWIGHSGSHTGLFQSIRQQTGADPKAMFHSLYRSMDDVLSFGRTAKFDYLTMLGKLGLAPIEPGSAYMKGATGPLTGAKLLFGGSKSARLDADTLDRWTQELDQQLQVGMQALEDSLCNWQKSPGQFRAFRG